MWLRGAALFAAGSCSRAARPLAAAAAARRCGMCTTAEHMDLGDELEHKTERPVQFYRRDAVRIVELARPQALNTLNLEMIRLMHARLKRYERDGDVRMVITRGMGGKAFCAGGDVRAIIESAKAGTNVCKDFFREEYALDHLIGTYTLPYVSILNGITMGGGVGISVHGLFRVATSNTMFAMPETAIGLFPDVGGSHFLPRLGHLGTFLALTGHRLTGLDVKHAGVATHFCTTELLDDLEHHLCIMAPDHITNAAVRHVLDEFQMKSLTHTTKHLSVVSDERQFSLQPHMKTINKCFAGDTVEQIMENLERDGGAFATKCRDTMDTMSPTSMKVTLRQLQKGAKMHFKDVFPMEYRLSQRCVEAEKDFWEGVRAVLIDKCGTPVWDPPRLGDVGDDYVDSFFAPFVDARRELVLRRSGAAVANL